MLVKGFQGVRLIANGIEAFLRFGRQSELIVAQAHGKYSEAVKNGRVFVASTDANGVAPGTAVGTTAAFALENPAGSGVILSIMRLVVSYISGTLGAGSLTYVYDDTENGATPIGTSTPITPQPASIGSRETSKAKAHDAATLLNTPTILRPFAGLQASLATTAVAPWQLREDVDGEFEVKPGNVLALEGIAAGGSTPLIQVGMTFEEIPV